MNVTQDARYPVTVGQRQIYLFSALGPSSYSTSTFDPVNLPAGIYLDFIDGCTTVSKTYFVRFFPSAAGSGSRPTWIAKWYTASTGSEVSNATNLSAEQIQFIAFGGNF